MRCQAAVARRNFFTTDSKIVLNMECALCSGSSTGNFVSNEYNMRVTFAKVVWERKIEDSGRPLKARQDGSRGVKCGTRQTGVHAVTEP